MTDKHNAELAALISQYKSKVDPTEREKALLERDMWLFATPEVRRSTERKKWLQAILGAESSYPYLKRAELLNAEPATLPLWKHIDERTMTPSRAMETFRQAKLTAATEDLPLAKALEIELDKYNRLPHVYHVEGGYTIRKPSPEVVSKREGKKKPGAIDPKEFYSELKKRSAEFLLSRLGDNVDQLTVNRLTSEFNADLKSLFDEWQPKLNRIKSASSWTPERPAIIKACRTLMMDPPKPGTPVDLAKAKKQKKKLARVYHPDVSAGETSGAYQAVMEAYDILEQANASTETRGSG